MGKGGKTEAAKPAPSLFTAWKINGKLYDLNEFAKTHPGGHRAIMNAAAHPQGELFVESYHPDPELVYNAIAKYEIKGDVELQHPIKEEFQSKIQYTFKDNDFYRKVKKTGMAALRGGKKGKKLSKTNLRGDDIYILVDVLHLFFLTLSTLFLIMGSWQAAIVTGLLRGMCIMRIAHVASHASLSPYPELNTIMYYLSMIFSGTTPEIWSRKHVVRHHINTNEDDLDEDRMEPVKCAAQGAPWFDFHVNQEYYMWPFYLHVVAVWSISDILQNNFRTNGGCLPYTIKDIAANMLTQFAHVMITYFLPIYYCGLWGLVLMEINTLITSCIFGFEFIVNHEIDGCDIYPETVGKEVDWGRYQTISSADFHPKGTGAWLFNQITGGLNLQICHHLFPGVHYRHYPALTKVIYEQCAKEGMEPTYSDNVVEAVVRHHRFLQNCTKKYAVAQADSKKSD